MKHRPMWWIQKKTGDWHVQADDGFGWLPASPVGEDARRIALLQCVPEGTSVPGVGYRAAGFGRDFLIGEY